MRKKGGIYMKNDKNRIQKIMYYPQPTRVYYLVYTAGNGINGGWTEYPAAEYPQLADLVGNPDATDDDFYRYTYDNNGAPYIKNADDSVIQRYKEEQKKRRKHRNTLIA